jgi:hypothetical protein
MGVSGSLTHDFPNLRSPVRSNVHTFALGEGMKTQWASEILILSAIRLGACLLAIGVYRAVAAPSQLPMTGGQDFPARGVPREIAPSSAPSPPTAHSFHSPTRWLDLIRKLTGHELEHHHCTSMAVRAGTLSSDGRQINWSNVSDTIRQWWRGRRCLASASEPAGHLVARWQSFLCLLDQPVRQQPDL